MQQPMVEQKSIASLPNISPTGLSEKDLLGALFAELSKTPLIIPHLPQANLLNNLHEWVRKRMKGKLTSRDHRKLHLKSLRRWLYLQHMDFRSRAAPAYIIPFTQKELRHMSWDYRPQIQEFFNILLTDFQTRNRKKLVMQAQIMWPTMHYDAYPSKAFLDIYYTYMPARLKDVFLINPYSSVLTPKSGAKTCPLSQDRTK